MVLRKQSTTSHLYTLTKPIGPVDPNDQSEFRHKEDQVKYIVIRRFLVEIGFWFAPPRTEDCAVELRRTLVSSCQIRFTVTSEVTPPPAVLSPWALPDSLQSGYTMS